MEASKYQPKDVQCIDCPEKFVLSPEAQEFFAGKGLAQPKRCGPCRGKNRKKHGTQKIVREKPAEAPRHESARFNTGLSDKELLDGVEPTSVGPNGERVWSVA
jgi:hypothetical protein